MFKGEEMFKKFLTYVFLTTLFFLIPSTLFASDLEITCFSNRSPEFVRNTDPLFEISGFSPGDSVSRIVSVENTDTENPCRIFFRVSGSTNTLTDKIEVKIPGIFDGTLSEYIGSSVVMANLAPNRQVTRVITMKLPEDAGDTYARRQASFDITVDSQWGEGSLIDEEDEDDDVDEITPVVAGVVDFFTDLIEGLIGIGMQDVAEIDDEEGEVERGEEKKNFEEILGITDTGGCVEKTLWWIPLVAQLILTLFVIFLNKSFFVYKIVKLTFFLIFGLISFFLIRWIGCPCDPIWLCTYHWIPNILIFLLPVFFRQKSRLSS
jgi:hypothetical protein